MGESANNARNTPSQGTITLDAGAARHAEIRRAAIPQGIQRSLDRCSIGHPARAEPPPDYRWADSAWGLAIVRRTSSCTGARVRRREDRSRAESNGAPSARARHHPLRGRRQTRSFRPRFACWCADNVRGCHSRTMMLQERDRKRSGLRWRHGAAAVQTFRQHRIMLASPCRR